MLLRMEGGPGVVAEHARWNLPLVLIITFQFIRALGISIILTFTHKVPGWFQINIM